MSSNSEKIQNLSKVSKLSKAKKTERAIEIVNRLDELYPHEPEDMNFLHFDDEFELLIMTILSAQTTDANVNSVRDILFEKYPTAQNLALADQEDVEQIIRPVGFFRTKSKHIIETSQKLCENFNGEVPCTMKELLTLSGVGRKTANIVLNQGFGNVVGIAVDTHVARLSKRLNFSQKKDANSIEKDLLKLLPEDYWKSINYLFIKHGREVCTSRNPKCEICTLQNYCVYYNDNK